MEDADNREHRNIEVAKGTDGECGDVVNRYFAARDESEGTV